MVRSSLLVALEQSRALKDSKVLGNGGEGNVKGACELCDRRAAFGEALNNGATRRVGQRGKRRIESSR